MVRNPPSSPTSTARLCACSAPATISEALALPPFTSTAIGMPVKSIIKRMDTMVFNKEPIPRDYRVYLNILLERRELGSRLGRNTMIFFFLASFIGCVFWLIERRVARRHGA